MLQNPSAEMDIFKILLLHGMIVLLLAPVLYHGTFAVFKKGAIYLSTKSLKTENPDVKLFNQAARVVKRESVEQGSGIGSNIYISLWYDCRNTDVLLEGKMPQTQHWSFTAYDLGTSLPVNSWLEKDSLDTGESNSYSVLLTTKPSGNNNELDVSQSPQGLMLLRLTNPEDIEKAYEQLPLVTEIQRSGNGLQ